MDDHSSVILFDFLIWSEKKIANHQRRTPELGCSKFSVAVATSFSPTTNYTTNQMN